MKKQIIQALWAIANGKPQVQGEKTVYPVIREQLNAIKMLISLDDWEEMPPVEAAPMTGTPTAEFVEIPQEVIVTPQNEIITSPKTVETSQKLVDTSKKIADTPQKPAIIPTKAVDTSGNMDIPQDETKPRTYRKGTYEEWLAQKELLERLLLEEKTKKIQAKLGKMTKSRSTSPASSV
nr:hypothetical protein [uncultured Capnocytophaga sp.]